MLRPALATFLLASAVPAQSAPAPRSFLPDDYRNVVFVDLAALRARGIWDDLEVSVLKLVFQQLQKELGFPLSSLDRITMVAQVGREEGMAGKVQEVRVLEGNAPLAQPESLTQGSWTEDTVGVHAVRRRRSGSETFVQPQPGLQVFGSTSLVQPVLEGKPHGGTPCPDVLSLLSGRSDGLAWFVLDVGNPTIRRGAFDRLFPEVAWPEGDEPQFVSVRLLATGDPEDPHLGIEAVVRHVQAGAGLETSATAVGALLEQLRQDPKMRTARPLLQRVEIRRDRCDLVAAVDLGRVRDAVGHVATLAMPLFAPLQVEQVVEAEPAAAPPPPKKQAP